MSDFLKDAYKHGKVKELDEAFKEYPVEEEWHKGDINSFINEDTIQYSKDYKVGDIVFVNEFKYKNGKIGYNHLFVIIDKDYLAVSVESFGLLISSKLAKLKFKSNILLKKDAKNHLNKDSIVKTDVIYKISNENICFKIGEVSLEKIEEYKSSFYANMNKD